MQRRSCHQQLGQLISLLRAEQAGRSSRISIYEVDQPSSLLGRDGRLLTGLPRGSRADPLLAVDKVEQVEDRDVVQIGRGPAQLLLHLATG